jgi:GGDEF domain-containing protein
VLSAHTSSGPLPGGDALERKAVGKIAAGVWAAIAFFGALATVKPLRFPEMDLSTTRVVVLSATVIAVVTLVVPWARAPKAFVNLLLVLMAGYITALAHSSGAVSSNVVLLLTFVVALAVCFLPVRTSVAQVVTIALLLAGGLVLVTRGDAGTHALRTSLLLSVLLVLCGLVLLLRAVIAQREAVVGHPIFDHDILGVEEFDKTLDREVARANRHGRALSLLLIEVAGTHEAGRPDADDERVVTAVATALVDRIRVEDSAGHLGGLRFGVIAPETPAEGAATVAENASQVVRAAIESLGYSSTSFDVAHGWAEVPHHASTRSELCAAAQHNLEAAAVRNELRRPSPTPADASRSTGTAPEHA